MCVFGSKPKAPAAPPPPPKPPEAPRAADAGVQAARGDDLRKQRAKAGRKSTIKTSPDLLGGATTTSNLLGS